MMIADYVKTAKNSFAIKIPNITAAAAAATTTTTDYCYNDHSITTSSGFGGGCSNSSSGGSGSRYIGLQIYATERWALYKFSLKHLVL